MMKRNYISLLATLAFICLPIDAQMDGVTNTTPTTGFTLAISVSEQDAVVTVDEIGPVIVKEKNITDHLINNTRPSNPCFWYRMDILRDGVQASKTEYMIQRESPSKEEINNTSPFLLSLKPGDEVEFRVPIDQCYDMSVPGSYQITFTWEREDFKDPNKILRTKSNTITVTVQPAGDPESKK